MVTGIIGKKVGMTQIFDADGTVHPATVIKAGPCVVVQAKTASTDGYESVQLGLVEERPARVGKPLAGPMSIAARASCGVSIHSSSRPRATTGPLPTEDSSRALARSQSL